MPAAALDPGEAPLSGLPVGASIELLEVPRAGPENPNPAGSADGPASDELRPVTIGSLASGQLWVSARVAHEVGLAASRAAQADTLRVVLIGGGG